MQVVELQGGIHLVDDSVLMNKSWELVHDGGNEVSIVGEANMDVVARNDLSSVVHAHVKSGIDTVDLNSSHGVASVLSVRDGVANSRVDSVEDGSKKI